MLQYLPEKRPSAKVVLEILDGREMKKTKKGLFTSLTNDDIDVNQFI